MHVVSMKLALLALLLLIGSVATGEGESLQQGLPTVCTPITHTDAKMRSRIREAQPEA